MQQYPDWAAEDIDPEIPSGARMYDYILGGSSNFASDRALIDELVRAEPGSVAAARANRSFLRRVVTYLVEEAGIVQFLDLGSGIPTAGNVHEIAQQHGRGVKVVYVDIDPVAVTMSRRLLAENADATAVRGDVRDLGPILGHPEVTGLLDFRRPLAVLALAVLPAIPDTAAMHASFAKVREALVSGSYLALSHISSDTPPGPTSQFVNVSRKTPTPGTIRSRAEIEAFFEDLTFVDPGLVELTTWHPDSTEAPTPVVMLGGVATKP